MVFRMLLYDNCYENVCAYRRKTIYRSAPYVTIAIK
jgi:hypothetical protein